MISSMESHCLSFREIPHTTNLFSSFLEDFSKVAEYFPHPPTAAGIASAVPEVKFDPSMRRSVVGVLREQNTRLSPGNTLDSATERNLERFAAGAVAVVTGQQVGLFSGPAFTIYKAVSILRVADEITRRGIDAVPVFWLATEDHDFAEVNHVFWSTRSGLTRYELPVAEGDSGHRVGEIVLGDAIEPVVRAAADSLEGTFAAEISRALRDSYRPGETFGTAFGKLIARLFAGRGIIFIDPLDARFHRLAAPVYLRTLQESEPLLDALLARSKDLESSGFHAQVKVTRETTLLFYNVDGRREPLRGHDGKFTAGSASFTPAEIRAAAENTPEAFTPNVLLRPVVQDSLLPTVAYIGGPAEIAYLAQAQVVYRNILGRMPAILPRSSFTIVEPPVARFLSKYELDFRDILRGPQQVRAAMQRKALPDALAQRFESDEQQLREMLHAYSSPIEKLDRTLLGTLESVSEKMLHQFVKLRESVGRAQNFRSGVLESHERALFDSLYPNHELQERSLCGLPFLAALGPQLLDDLLRFSSVSGLGDTSSCPHQHHILFV